jgi:FMN phosphatase YigB (HAD superfamily)
MLKAVIFDLDNTLVDFMLMKKQAIDAAINAMRDAGLKLSTDEIRHRIDQIYNERGIEFQSVFDELLYREFSKIDHKILSAGVIAYRRAREAALVPYPHVTFRTLRARKRGFAFVISTFITSSMQLSHSMILVCGNQIRNHSEKY